MTLKETNSRFPFVLCGVYTLVQRENVQIRKERKERDDISRRKERKPGGQIEGWTVEIIDIQKKKRRKKTATPRKRPHTAETSTYYGPHYITFVFHGFILYSVYCILFLSTILYRSSSMNGPLRLFLYPVLFTILSLFSILYYTIYYSMSKLYRVPRFSLSLLLPSRHASSLTTPP